MVMNRKDEEILEGWAVADFEVMCYANLKGPIRITKSSVIRFLSADIWTGRLVASVPDEES